MLNRFPGRFLSEIDDALDFPRHLRAWQAERIEALEEKRETDLGLTNFSLEEKVAILQHDRWLKSEEENGSEES